MQETVSPTALRDLLQSRGLTNADVAYLADVSEPAMSRIVSGEQRPRRTTVWRVAKALGISARRLEAMTAAAWDPRRHGRAGDRGGTARAPSLPGTAAAGEARTL